LPLSPRRRALIAGIVMAAVGFIALWSYHQVVSSATCRSSTVRVLRLCGYGSRHHSSSRVLLAVVVVVAGIAICWALSLWVMRPLRPLTQMIDRMGPQNLAERAPVAPGRGETTDLTVAVNGMMDRLAAGYEGQRSFAANASHELRTPLAVQRTLIEVSMANSRSPEQIALLTDQLLETNARNERLIEGLLVLSESDRGLASRTSQPLDEITAGVVDVHRDLAKQAGVTLHASLAPRVVAGERVLIERLVTNLVRNAIVYNVQPGEVTITVGAAPALVVENTGTPVPAESVDGLFEPFRRGTADRTHHGGGAGLGLTIVRSIAQAHDGSVVARARPDGGLRVEVALP
jgi:signal transduction histidine kinase